MRRRVLLIAPLSLVASLAWAKPPAAPPDSHVQSIRDGCHRWYIAQYVLAMHEWQYVNRASVAAARLAGDQNAGRATIEGLIAGIYPAGQDQFTDHDYNDFHQVVALDRAFANYAATGNPTNPSGRREMDTEWEEALVPTWAWPGIGDRVRQSGRWIWDCGHWGNGPADPTPAHVSQLMPLDPAETAQDLAKRGAISGEKTEIHPLDQMATWRKDAAGFLKGQRTATELKRFDVWISGDSSLALSAEECGLYGLPPAAVVALQTTLCPRTTDVGGTYRYTIDVGPRPRKDSKLIVNDVIIHPETDAGLRSKRRIIVTPHPGTHTVDVRFTLPHRKSVPTHFGISVEAGWTHARPAVHHVVRIDRINIRASLDGATEANIHFGTTAGPEQTPDPGEWNMFVAVNGHWKQVPPNLKSASGRDTFNQLRSGDVFNRPLTFDFWLPQGVPATLFVGARECDIPLLDCRKDRYGAPRTDYTHPFTEVGLPDEPGMVGAYGVGVPIPEGITSTFAPLVNPDPTSRNDRLSDHSCGGPCYTVTVSATAQGPYRP